VAEGCVYHKDRSERLVRPCPSWGVCADGEFLCVEGLVGVPDTQALAQVTGFFSVPTEDDAFAQQQAGAGVEGDADVIMVVVSMGGDDRFAFPTRRWRPGRRGCGFV